MDTSFDELKALMDPINAGNLPTRSEFHRQVVELLASHGIGLRGDDGINPIATISYPTSLPGSIVIGLRYTKKDDTKTEDHFLFQAGQPIERCYGKRLEGLFPEYKGAHKFQR